MKDRSVNRRREGKRREGLNHLLNRLLLDTLSHGNVVFLNLDIFLAILLNALLVHALLLDLSFRFPTSRLLARCLYLLPATLSRSVVETTVCLPLRRACFGSAVLRSLLRTVSRAAFGEFPGELEVQVALFDAEGGDAVADAAS